MKDCTCGFCRVVSAGLVGVSLVIAAAISQPVFSITTGAASHAGAIRFDTPWSRPPICVVEPTRAEIHYLCIGSDEP